MITNKDALDKIINDEKNKKLGIIDVQKDIMNDIKKQYNINAYCYIAPKDAKYPLIIVCDDYKGENDYNDRTKYIPFITITYFDDNFNNFNDIIIKDIKDKIFNTLDKSKYTFEWAREIKENCAKEYPIKNWYSWLWQEYMAKYYWQYSLHFKIIL